MEISRNWLQRQVVNGMVVLLIAPLAQAAPASRQQAGGRTAAQTSQQSAPAESGTSAALPSAPAQQQTAPAQPASTQQQTNAAEPVGTAAAPYEAPVGAAVSRPAGAAIAPAKQRRRRSLLIRMGLVIGAAVAVGTVVALSKASPSRPGH